MMAVMTRHLTAGVILVGMIALAGCSSPSRPTAEDTADLLKAAVLGEYGEEYIEALGDDWFADIAEGIVENCDDANFRSGFMAGFDDQPSMQKLIDNVWVVTCES